jgi:serine/threonine-protein kinase
MSELQERLGAALGGTYVIERELGGGGMSRVFLARETALGRTVVIKVLPPELDGALSVDRFRREISLCARLQHPTIVPLLTAGEADGLLYYTMPYIEGTTLRAELDRAGALPIDRATGILRDILEALSFAHAHGVIHRDVKPENILLAPHHAVVSDFGVAKAIAAAGGTDAGGRTGTGLVIGSPAYMAPEQAAADPAADHRADLYAVGVVAFEMFAGSGPFPGRTPSQTLAAHMTERAPPLASKRRDVPPAIASLVARLLEKDPARRPQSAEEALSAVSATTAGAGRAVRVALIGASMAVIVALASLGIAKWRSPSRAAAVSRPPAIAVLRFEDRSAGGANAYLAEGLSDEIIGSLSRVPGLRVVGRTSSFRFRADSTTAEEVGRRLNVGAVLVGSVQREGDSLRVVASLMDASTNGVLWQEKYDRKMSSVFRIEDEVASAIATRLSTRLAPAGAPDRAENMEAYQLYLQGRYFFNRRTAESLRKSIDLYEQAIALDSTYARAWAGLADAWNVIGALMYVPPRDALPKGKAAAERAIALDDGLSDAHATLGFVHLFYDWDWDGARRELERAIALDPNAPIAHLYYGYYLDIAGQPEEAVRENRRALELDPLSMILNLRYGDALQFARRYDDAIAQYRRTHALDSSYALLGTEIPLTYVMRGDYETALREFERFSSPGKPYLGGDLIYALARSGQRDSARKVLAALQRRASGERVRGSARAQDEWEFVVAYLGLGMRDSTLSAIRQAMDERGAFIIFIASDPMLDELHGDARFTALLRRANLPYRAP